MYIWKLIYFSPEGVTRASGESCIAMINLCIWTVFGMHSLLDFTILYPKHKHLVQNEFPQDAKLGPISNLKQVFSKGINLDFQAQIQHAFQTLICVQII